MTCDDASDLIDAEIDGTIASGDRLKLDEHIAACDACVEARLGLQKAAAILHSHYLATGSEPATLLLGVEDAIRQHDASFQHARGRHLVVGAALGLLVGIGATAIFSGYQIIGVRAAVAREITSSFRGAGFPELRQGGWEHVNDRVRQVYAAHFQDRAAATADKPLDEILNELYVEVNTMTVQPGDAIPRIVGDLQELVCRRRFKKVLFLPR